MKKFILSVLFTSLSTAVAQQPNQADSCEDPTKYHPEGSSACVPCPDIVNAATGAEVYCTEGESDRRFNPANTVHCLDGYFADVTGADTDICQQETVCGAATVSTAGIDNYQLTPPTKDTDRVCAAWAVCTATQYETVAPDSLTNRECATRLQCTDAQYQNNANPLAFNQNRECAPLTVCGAADVSTAEVGNYQTTPPTATSDRVCATWLECDNTQFISRVPTALLDTECTSLAVCNNDNYETTAPTATSDRVCASWDVCNSNQYQTVEPDADTNRVCASLTVCDGDQWETKAPTTTSNRECQSRQQCTLGQEYQSNTNNPLEYNEDRICTVYSTACSDKYWKDHPDYLPGDEQYFYTPAFFQAEAATATQDVVCQAVTICDGTTSYESIAAVVGGGSVNGNDRQCNNPVSDVCADSGKYKSGPATPLTDISCETIINCPGGYYETVAPTATSNRQCGAHKDECDAANEFQSVAPTSEVDRECTQLQPCTQGSTYEASPPSGGVYTAQRVCSPVAPPCVSGSTYQTTAPTLEVNRVCSPVTGKCGDSHYESIPPDVTTNRVCTALEICDGVNKFEPEPIAQDAGQYVEARNCSDVLTCGDSQWESAPPTPISNRVCADWTVCGAPDVTTATGVLTGKETYETDAPTTTSDRQCALQAANCSSYEYESIIGDATTKRVCLAKKLTCGPGQFLIKSVDGDQPNIDNRCDVCPESLIPNVIETDITCQDICSNNITTVSTQCSIKLDSNNQPLMNLQTNPISYSSDDATNFEFTNYNCKTGYYDAGQTCLTCRDPDAGFKEGTHLVCSNADDVESFICEPGFYIVTLQSNTYSCAADLPCGADYWAELPVNCDTFDNGQICSGVDPRVCHELTPCGDGERVTTAAQETNGVLTSDQICSADNACEKGQYVKSDNTCGECKDDITNSPDRLLASECQKQGDDIIATACVTGFKISGTKCVFDTGVVEHNIASSSNCDFQKLSNVFDFEWTFDHSKHTNPDFASSIKFKEFRGTEYYLGKTTSTFNLKNFGSNTNSYKYWSILNSTNSANYKNFVESEITSATEVMRVVCFVKPKYPDLTSNTFTPADLDEDIFKNADCDEIKYITPFTYDAGDPEWTQLTNNLVVSSVNPESAHYTKSVGVSSKCGGSGGTIHDVFAWSTLKTSYEDIVNFKLKINLSDIGLGGSQFDSPIEVDLTVEEIEFEGNVEVFDLLYISGDYTSEEKVATSAVDYVVFDDVIAPNGPHRSGNVKIEGSVSHKCSVDLTVSSPNDDFHCFDSDGIAARVSNSYTTTHLNMGATVSACTAALSSNCVPVVTELPTITDSRKCLADETYSAECETELNDIEVQALKTEIDVKSVIVDAIRLHDTHQFPKEHASGTFSAIPFVAASDEFTCDDAACTSDPYIVLDVEAGKYEHTCKWSTGGTGSIITSGQTDGADNVVDATCSDSARTAGSIPETQIRLPGKIFPQFYVYGITTFSKQPTKGGLPNTVVINDGSGPVLPNPDPSGAQQQAGRRRLGGTRSAPPVETKSVFVVSPQKVIAK